MEVTNERVKVFPRLEKLTLDGCLEPRSAPSHFPSLKELIIYGMNNGGNAITSILSNSLTTLTLLSISSVKGLAGLPESLLENNRNLSRLTLLECLELTHIAPPQSHFSSSLVELAIVGCHKLEFLPIIPEINDLTSLPDLIEIRIIDCPRLSNLPEGLQYCTSLESMHIGQCPMVTSISIPIASLVKLVVVGCLKVTSIPTGSLSTSTTLQELIVSDVESLPSLHGGFTSLCELGIWNCQSTQIGLHQLPSRILSFNITDCPNLETVPSLEKLTSLCQLTILYCPRLTCLPGGISPNLKELFIGPFKEELDSFPAIQALPQLQKLQIHGWPKLKSLPEQIQRLMSLKELFIPSFEGVETIPDWLGNLASLESLSISSCRNLKYLPSVQAMQGLMKLDDLWIRKCALLSERCTHESGPEWPNISRIPHIDVENDDM